MENDIQKLENHRPKQGSYFRNKNRRVVFLEYYYLFSDNTTVRHKTTPSKQIAIRFLKKGY